MNTIVENYINQRKAEIKEAEQKKRSERLLELGICKKEYSDVQNDEYPNFEWINNEKLVYYKAIPIEVTDEEYAEVMKYADEDGGVGFTLKKLGKIVLSVGVIVSMILGFGIMLGAFAFGGSIAVIGTIASIALISLGVFVFIILGKLIQGFGELICTTKRIEDKIKQR